MTSSINPDPPRASGLRDQIDALEARIEEEQAKGIATASRAPRWLWKTSPR